MSAEAFYSPKILGTGSFLPERVVPNSFLEQKMKLDPGVIFTTLGVLERRSCRDLRDLRTRRFDFGDHKTNPPEVMMGVLAAEKAIEDTDIDKSEIDSVLFGAEIATTVPDFFYEEALLNLAILGLTKREKRQFMPLPIPGGGRPPVFQFLERMGLFGRVRIYPFNLFGCADLHYYLSVASVIEDGKMLVVASSAASILADLRPSRDLNQIITQSLFGDGASAAVLDFSTRPPDQGLTFFLGSDFEKNPVSINPLRAIKKYPKDLGLYINHRMVLKSAPEAMIKAISGVLKTSGLNPEDIDHFLLHQASGPTYRRTLTLLREQFGEIDPKKIPTNYQTLGNTGFTSTLLLLDQGRRLGTIKEGQIVLMASAGAGMNYAALLFKA